MTSARELGGRLSLSLSPCIFVSSGAGKAVSRFNCSTWAGVGSSGRPIAAGLAGEAAQLLTESEGALVVAPSDPEALAEALAALADTPSEALLQMGLKGRTYYQRNMAFQQGVHQTLRLLEGTHLAS